MAEQSIPSLLERLLWAQVRDGVRSCSTRLQDVCVLGQQLSQVLPLQQVLLQAACKELQHLALAGPGIVLDPSKVCIGQSILSIDHSYDLAKRIAAVIIEHRLDCISRRNIEASNASDFAI